LLSKRPPDSRTTRFEKESPEEPGMLGAQPSREPFSNLVRPVQDVHNSDNGLLVTRNDEFAPQEVEVLSRLGGPTKGLQASRCPRAHESVYVGPQGRKPLILETAFE